MKSQIGNLLKQKHYLSRPVELTKEVSVIVTNLCFLSTLARAEKARLDIEIFRVRTTLKSPMTEFVLHMAGYQFTVRHSATSFGRRTTSICSIDSLNGKVEQRARNGNSPLTWKTISSWFCRRRCQLHLRLLPPQVPLFLVRSYPLSVQSSEAE